MSHAIAGVLAVALGMALGRDFLAPFLRAVRRMRWFFLSIVVLYVWFVPVEDVSLVGEITEPVWYIDGVVSGLERVMVLAVILVAVTSFIVTTDRNALLNAVLWLSRPAVCFGLSPETIAVRFTLLFSVLAEMQMLVEETRSVAQASQLSRWERWRDSASTLFTETIDRAMSAPLDSLALPPIPPPRLREWCIPAALGLIGIISAFG